MLQINLHVVSVGLAWLLLSQTHTSIGRSAPTLFFIRLLINSACTTRNCHWAFYETYACYFTYARREGITFSHLSWKFHLTLLPLIFPQTLFMPSPKSQTISDDRLKDKAEDHPFFTFAHCCGYFLHRSQRDNPDLRLESNVKASSVFPFLWKGNIWTWTRHQNYWERWS